MANNNNQSSRRKFIEQTALASAALIITNPLQLLSQTNNLKNMSNNIKSKGYAAKDSSGKLSLWEFERRPLGDNDILIDIKYSSICHSDIHQMRGHWGPQQYPQVPGHEIAGIVAAVGKNSKWATKPVLAVWWIAVWNVKAAKREKNIIAKQLGLPVLMAILKNPHQQVFHKAVILITLW
jgi:NADPH:quinone reductase-like Zn-dependent oxidoreductase